MPARRLIEAHTLATTVAVAIASVQAWVDQMVADEAPDCAVARTLDGAVVTRDGVPVLNLSVVAHGPRVRIRCNEHTGIFEPADLDRADLLTDEVLWQFLEDHALPVLWGDA